MQNTLLNVVGDKVGAWPPQIMNLSLSERAAPLNKVTPLAVKPHWCSTLGQQLRHLFWLRKGSESRLQVHLESHRGKQKEKVSVEEMGSGNKRGKKGPWGLGRRERQGKRTWGEGVGKGMGVFHGESRRFHSPLWTSNIPLYVCTTVSLSTHLQVSASPHSEHRHSWCPSPEESGLSPQWNLMAFLVETDRD